jgi:4-hydroxy-2-oxoheptanedioate aldolase
VAEANDEIVCIAMIETREGIDNLESIATTPGLGGVYVGPNDLALALGLPVRGDTDDPLHRSTVESILRVCKQHGVPAGIHTGGVEYTRIRLEAGFDFVTLGTDAGFMMQAVTANLAAVRGARRRESENTGYS